MDIRNTIRQTLYKYIMKGILTSGKRDCLDKDFRVDLGKSELLCLVQ